MPPQANIVCFRPKRPATCDEATWNEVVRALRKRHLSEGSGYLVQTEFGGRVWLRCTLMNPLTEHRDLEVMLGELDAMLAKSPTASTMGVLWFKILYHSLDKTVLR